MAGALWEVVGGADKGIIVRTGRELKSDEHPDGRLTKGSVVVQLELVGERLRYTLLDGEGPLDGWISLKLKEAKLVVPYERKSLKSSTPLGKRIWILSQGSRGDVQPMVVLGASLLQAGYDVRVFAAPEQKSFVESLDLDFTAQAPNAKEGMEKMIHRYNMQAGIGEDKEKETMDLTLAVFVNETVVTECAKGIFEMLKTEVPDLVITSHLIGAPSFLPWKLHGVRTLDLTFAHAPAFKADEELRVEDYEATAVTIPWTEAAVGVNPMADVTPEMWATYRKTRSYGGISRALAKTVYSQDGGEVDEKPLSMCTGFLPMRPAWSVKDVSAFGGAENLVKMQAFLDADPKRPPVYMGWGSMPVPAAIAIKVVFYLKIKKLRAIICRGWSEVTLEGISKTVLAFMPQDQMGLIAYMKDPKNILFVDACPHEWIFPRCLAAIHHGGMGTLHTTLRLGLPSIIAPIAVDQFRNAEQLEKLGLGARYDPKVQDMQDPAFDKALTLVTKDAAFRKKVAEFGETLRKEDGIATMLEVVAKVMSERENGSQADVSPRPLGL